MRVTFLYFDLTGTAPVLVDRKYLSEKRIEGVRRVTRMCTATFTRAVSCSVQATAVA